MKKEEKKQSILYQADEENKEEKRTGFDKTGKCNKSFKAAACCIAVLLALTACTSPLYHILKRLKRAERTAALSAEELGSPTWGLRIIKAQWSAS